MKNVLICIDCTTNNKKVTNIVPNIVKKIEEFKNGIIITTYCDKNNEINSDIADAIEKRVGVDGVTKVNIQKQTFGSVELATMVQTIVETTEDDISIDICGFGSDNNIISNAALINTLLYNKDRATISIIKDCCVGTTVRKHNAAIEVMKSCQINVI